MLAGLALATALLISTNTPANAAKPTASAPGKPYSVTISPDTAPSGSTKTFTFTFTVAEDAQQQLGALELVPPGDVTLDPDSYSGPGTPTISAARLELNNVGLQPGDAPLTFTVAAKMPCSPTAALAWGIRAKQANEFNGAGNDLDLAEPTPTLTVDGACSLRFVNQPTHALVGGVITASPFTPIPRALPVRAEVIDGAGARISNPSITLAKNTGPSEGVLTGGNTSVTATDGLTSFSNLSLDVAGYYTLKATSGDLAPAISNTLRIYPGGLYCADDDPECTATVASEVEKTQVSVTAVPGGGPNDNDTGLLILGMNTGPQIECAGYTHFTSDTAIVDMTSALRTKTATLTIDKAQMALEPNNGASFLEFCFGSPVSFDTKGRGTSVKQSYQFDWNSDGILEDVYVGLLPNCSRSTPAPCVTSRNKTGAGDGVIKANLPKGDPAMRG